MAFWNSSSMPFCRTSYHQLYLYPRRKQVAKLRAYVLIVRHSPLGARPRSRAPP